jgi:hypothetical protein
MCALKKGAHDAACVGAHRRPLCHALMPPTQCMLSIITTRRYSVSVDVAIGRFHPAFPGSNAMPSLLHLTKKLFCFVRFPDISVLEVCALKYV